MSTTNVMMNHTLATPLIRTENSTSIPLNNPVGHPNSNTSINGSLPGYGNNSVYWNYTIYNSSVYNPYCPGCFPDYVTIGPPLITYSYTYTYAYYVILIILLIVAVICIKIGISRRKQMEQRAASHRRRARQQVESAYVPTTNGNNNFNNNSGTGASAKQLDLPPAYEDIAQSDILIKQQQQSAKNTPIEGTPGMTTNLSTNAISTLTIETELSNSNYVSTVNINQIANNPA